MLCICVVVVVVVVGAHDPSPPCLVPFNKDVFIRTEITFCRAHITRLDPKMQPPIVRFRVCDHPISEQACAILFFVLRIAMAGWLPNEFTHGYLIQFGFPIISAVLRSRLASSSLSLHNYCTHPSRITEPVHASLVVCIVCVNIAIPV